MKACKSSKLMQYIDDEVWSKYSLQEGKSLWNNLETNKNMPHSGDIVMCKILKINQSIQNETNREKNDDCLKRKVEFDFRSFIKGIFIKLKSFKGYNIF